MDTEVPSPVTPAIAPSWSALAKAVGLKRQSVVKWRKNPAWQFGPTPPYNVAEVLAWHAHHIAPVKDAAAGAMAPVVASEHGTPMPAELYLERVKYTAGKAKRVQIENEKLLGQLVSRVEAERHCVGLIRAIKEHLFNFCLQAPAEVAEACEKMIVDAFNALADSDLATTVDQRRAAYATPSQENISHAPKPTKKRRSPARVTPI